MLPVFCSITFQGSTGFTSGDWGCHWRSLSCSWNQFALWHGALTCLKKPLEDDKLWDAHSQQQYVCKPWLSDMICWHKTSWVHGLHLSLLVSMCHCSLILLFLADRRGTWRGLCCCRSSISMIFISPLFLKSVFFWVIILLIILSKKLQRLRVWRSQDNGSFNTNHHVWHQQCVCMILGIQCCHLIIVWNKQILLSFS